MNKIVFPILVILLSCQSNQNQDADKNQLGSLDYDIPVSEDSKQSFDRGLLLLHSFEYEDAREAFEEALSKDSSEVMAYWGVAMSHYKALWGLVDLDKGRAIMQKLGKTPEERLSKTSAGVERDLWKGIEILYSDGELKDRNESYTKHMADLYNEYEGNQEIAAFYSLALMWSASIDADNEVYKLSANVAEGILAENPNHPGAVHYTIHAYDNPELSHLAIDAADKYAIIAPDAAHALHMPSHIYLSRGMWNEMVASNEASYQASVNRMERKNLDNNARGYHSYQWLHYGYLQQGRYEDAKKLLKDMLVYTQKTQSKSARAYLIKMQCMQLIESGEWGLEEKPLEINTDDIGIEKQAQQHFFKVIWAKENDLYDSIVLEISALNSKIEAAEVLVTSAGISMCSAGPARYAPNKFSVMNAKVMLHQMQAIQAMVNDESEKAQEFMQKAVALEQSSRYSYGPPDVMYPSFEQYGNYLLEQKQYEGAIKMFNLSLERAPMRAIATRGKIEALLKLNRNEEAKELESAMSESWKPDTKSI